ncbi:MAG: ribonuclease R [Ruminococcaceae bacterium]|nr:ribonuclease R [Oscillospiraceae bacterium]
MADKNHIPGIIYLTAKGTAFVSPSADISIEDKRDIFIDKKNTMGAMTGDTVLVELYKREISLRLGGGSIVSGNRREGKIVKILEKGRRIFSGNIYSYGSYLCVEPDNLKVNGIIRVKGDVTGITGNDKVVCEIISMPMDRKKDGEAVVIEVVGKAGDASADITAMMKACGIVPEFPDDVLEEAAGIPSELDADTVEKYLKKGRRDLRELTIVTIDGEDTKDVDDGVSIRMLKNGNYLLGVHIADVNEYVKPGSALDREAYDRATSVYLADRVIPMLPRSLSNGICSLNVGVDRLAFTVMIEVSPSGAVVNHEIFESIIKVKYKISYEKLYALLEDSDPVLLEEYKEHAEDLLMMRNLADSLNWRRQQEGYINFDFPETKVVLDAEGNTIEVKPYTLTFANNVIEEFMLLCNRVVAEDFHWRDVPFLYRVHEDPDPEKIGELARIVKNLGYSLKGKSGGDIHPKSFRTLLDAAKGRSTENLVNLLTLRSMRKAVYSHECLGHFGLSMKYYTHFTSPIRRYPDLMIHRIMKLIINGDFTEDIYDFYAERMPDIAKQCSAMERRAADAERDSIDIKCVEYMKQFEGETFIGTISGITGFGMFIVLDNTVEGLLRYSEMRGRYEFDSDYMVARNIQSGRVFHIGDSVRVILAEANTVMRQIEFVPANEHAGDSRRSTKPRRSPRKSSGGKSSFGIPKKGKKKAVNKNSSRKRKRR